MKVKSHWTGIQNDRLCRVCAFVVATGTASLFAQEATPAPTPAVTPAPPAEAIPAATPELTPEALPGVLPAPLSPDGVPLEFPGIAPFDYSGAVAIPVEGYDAAALIPDDVEAATPVPAVPSSVFSFPRLPSGFSNLNGSDFSEFTGGMADLLDGFNISATFSGTYESNVYQGASNPAGSSSEDSFVLGLGTNLSYRTQGTEWFLGGNYSGTYNEYLSQSELSAYNQSFGLSGGYTGPVLTSTLSLGITSDSGANRIYGEVTDVVTTTVDFNTSYTISPKSSINANAGYSMSDSDTAADTSNFDFGLFGLWRLSPLTQLGPGIRYSLATGDDHPDRTTIGPTFNLNYQAGSKLSLNSRIGLDFPSYQGGDSGDPGLSTSIGANYRASEIWGMNLSLVRDVQADPSTPDVFSEVTALRLGYNRKIRRATLNVGCGFETTSAEDSSAGSAGEDRDYFTVDASLSMMIFANTTQASIFTSLSDQSGGNAGTSGDGFQCGFSLTRGF